MKIIELNIIEFGCLTDRHFVFEDGLNIIEGNNETGKSTLWLFIKFMLYGMPKKGHPERERAINRTTHRAMGSMVVEHGKKSYRIERSFSENSRGKVTTYDLLSGEKVFGSEEPGVALLGVPREVFESSCGIGQSACTDLGGDKGVTAIKNILSSADENLDVKKIEKRLDDIRIIYRHKKGNGGRLYEMSEKRAELDQKLRTATENKLQISIIEENLKTIGSELEKAEKDLQNARALVGKTNKIALIKRFDQIRENERLRDEKEEEKKRLVAKEVGEGNIPTEYGVASLSGYADNVERASKYLRSCTEYYNNLLHDQPYDEELSATGELITELGGEAKIRGEFKRRKSGKALHTALMIAGGVIAVAGIPFTVILPLIFVGIPMIVIGILMLAGAIVWEAVAGSKFKVSPYYELYMKEHNAPDKSTSYISECINHLNKKQTYSSELKSAEEECAKAKREENDRLSDLTHMLRQTSLTESADVDGARREVKRLKDFLEKYRELSNLIDRLNAMIYSDNKVLDAYNEAELRSEIGEELLTLEAISTAEAERKERFSRERRDTLSQKEKNYRETLINLRATCESPQLIADQLTELNDRYNAAEEYFKAVEMAMNGLSRAAESMRGNITPAICANSGRFMDKFSNGRYRNLSVSGEMDVSIIDERGMTTTVEMMSGGTCDAAYIALRMALAMQIFGGDMPPLMMDETLCQLDDERAERILSMLSSLCADGIQCLLFTCHRREGEICASSSIRSSIIKM